MTVLSLHVGPSPTADMRSRKGSLDVTNCRNCAEIGEIGGNLSTQQAAFALSVQGFAKSRNKTCGFNRKASVFEDGMFCALISKNSLQ